MRFAAERNARQSLPRRKRNYVWHPAEKELTPCAHDGKPTRMSNELFQVNPTPVPPLELARRRLREADAAVAEAAQVVDEQGPEGEPLLDAAQERRSAAAAEVLRLEGEAVKR